VNRRRNGEGTRITLRPDGRYWARLRIGGKQQSFYGKTKRQVADRIDAERLRVAEGQLVVSSRVPLGYWLDQWLSDHVEPSVALTTYERYRGIIRNYVDPELGTILLCDLTAAHIQRFYRTLHDQGLSPSTVGVIHSVVHRCLRDARRVQLLGVNVAEDAQPPKPRDRDATDRAFSEAELAVLDTAIAGQRHEQLWRFLLATGLRIGEAAALRWSDVDLEAERVLVRRSYRRTLSGPVVSTPKTRRGRRTVPLGPAALTALKAQRTRVLELWVAAAVWEDQDLVFPNQLGRPIRPDKVLDEFKAVQTVAGLQPRRLHDLRHTFATRMYRHDVHPRTVQDLLGHARLEMTMDLYTGSLTEAQIDAVRRLG
jgi:integrase